MSSHDHEPPVTYATGGVINGPTLSATRCCPCHREIIGGSAPAINVNIEVPGIGPEVTRAISERVMEMVRGQGVA
jgi:hypothetical protein